MKTKTKRKHYPKLLKSVWWTVIYDDGAIDTLLRAECSDAREAARRACDEFGRARAVCVKLTIREQR
jgi:hypothetical protein